MTDVPSYLLSVECEHLVHLLSFPSPTKRKKIKRKEKNVPLSYVGTALTVGHFLHWVIVIGVLVCPPPLDCGSLSRICAF